MFGLILFRAFQYKIQSLSTLFEHLKNKKIKNLLMKEHLWNIAHWKVYYNIQYNILKTVILFFNHLFLFCPLTAFTLRVWWYTVPVCCYTVLYIFILYCWLTINSFIVNVTHTHTHTYTKPPNRDNCTSALLWSTKRLWTKGSDSSSSSLNKYSNCRLVVWCHLF